MSATRAGHPCRPVGCQAECDESRQAEAEGECSPDVIAFRQIADAGASLGFEFLRILSEDPGAAARRIFQAEQNADGGFLVHAIPAEEAIDGAGGAW